MALAGNMADAILGGVLEIIIETFRAYGEPSANAVRARALPGQGVPTDLRVECARRIRRDYPVGTLFRVWATLTDREGTSFLYTDYRGTYEPVTPDQARTFIAQRYGQRV